MKRRSGLTVALVVGAAALVAVFAGTGSADHPGSQTLTFVERNNQGTFRFIDSPPKSPRRGEPRISLGDVFLGSNPLYNAANTRRVGRFFFKCTAVRRSKRPQGGTFQCEGTARLSDGTLVISAILSEGPATGAVVGGTGAYEGASGSFTSEERRRTSVDTVHFDTD